MGFLKTKGEKIFFVLFLACLCTGAVLLAAALVFQLGNVNIASISITGADMVKASNGRIFVRRSADPAGYYVYDNTTFEQLGARYTSTGWSSYGQIAPVGDLVYSVSGYPWPNSGTVEFWDSSNTVTANASIGFSSMASCVCVQGSYAYFGLGNQCVAIVNATLAPSSLNFINVTTQMGFGPDKVMVMGAYLYACGGKISVCNVSNITCPGSPKLILNAASDFAIRNNFLYAVGDDGNLSIYDISSPMTPIQAGFLNVSQNLNLKGIALTTRGDQVLALIWMAEKTAFFVVDVTDPNAPNLLGIKMVKVGSATSMIYYVAADAGRVYVANGLGVCILSKETLIPINLAPVLSTYSLGEIIWIICIIVISVCPLWGAFFLWSRDKRVARAQGRTLWITPKTLIRTLILFAAMVVLGELMVPFLSSDPLLYSTITVGIMSVFPLFLYWRQRRLGTGGEAELSKEQLLERLKVEKDARAHAEEEGRRKAEEERKKKEADKEAKQKAKEDAKRRQAEEEAQKKHEQEEARMRKLQQIVKVSARLPIDRIAQMLEMDSEEVWKRVLDWAERFHFTIDGQDLIFNKETVNDFISSLDKEFKQWGKEGKV